MQTGMFDDLTADEQISDEWYTPFELIESVRLCLGTIELDPASCASANQVVRATRYYTRDNDGLRQPWTFNDQPARVWLNPPYKTPVFQQFMERTVRAITEDEVTALILITTNRTETGWYQDLLAATTRICILGSRLSFWRPGLHPTGTARAGHTLFYYGSEPDRFRRIFTRWGKIYKEDT